MDDSFEDENLAFLPADHPLMAGLQAAMRRKLEEDLEKAHLQLKEREAELKKIEREREDAAVQLYEVQQNFPEMHLGLEKTHQNFNLIINRKKTLLDRCKKSLLEMQRRDKALRVVREALKAQYETTSKIIGVNNEIIKEEETVEALTEILKELKLEEKRLDDENEKLEYGQKKLNAHIKILQQSLQSTETLDTQAKKLFESMVSRINEHKMLENVTANHLRQTTQSTQENEEKKFNEQLIILEAQLLAQEDEKKGC